MIKSLRQVISHYVILYLAYSQFHEGVGKGKGQGKGSGQGKGLGRGQGKGQDCNDRVRSYFYYSLVLFRKVFVMRNILVFILLFSSTCQAAVELVCEFDDASVIYWADHEQMMDQDFTIEIEEKKGSISLIPTVNSYGVMKSGTDYIMTNDYIYASGNYLSKSIYKLVLERPSGALAIFDIEGNANGTGACSKAELNF